MGGASGEGKAANGGPDDKAPAAASGGGKAGAAGKGGKGSLANMWSKAGVSPIAVVLVRGGSLAKLHSPVVVAAQGAPAWLRCSCQ